MMFLSFFRKKEGDQSPKKESQESMTDDNELKFTVYDVIRTIKDPEKPNTLEELNVVYEDGVEVVLEKMAPKIISKSIFSVNKQINDKERIAAAMENPNLKGMVENCIAEEDS